MAHAETKSSSGGLLVFEGAENVGKTTLAQALTDRLCAQGHPANYLAFPGQKDGTLGRHVYDIEQEPGSFGIQRLNPLSRQVLHVAAHVDAIEFEIRPGISAGKWIVLDRFWWSTWVYGRVTGVGLKALDHLIEAERACWDRIIPSAVFLIRRSAPVKEPLTPEWSAIAKSYEQLAQAQQGTHPIVPFENDGDFNQKLAFLMAWAQANVLRGNSR